MFGKKTFKKNDAKSAGLKKSALVNGEFSRPLGGDTRLSVSETVGPPSAGEAPGMLRRSLEYGAILTARFDRCRVTTGKDKRPVYALLASYGQYTVSVELSEFTRDDVASLWRRGGSAARYPSEEALTRAYIRARLGGEADFMVTELDQSRMTAKASRVSAMDKKRAYYWFATTSDGYYIQKDALMQARVVAVDGMGVLAELFGVETYIPLEELDYGEVSNARALFRVGDMINVRTKEITRGGDNSVEAEASIREALVDWRCENVTCLKGGSVERGSVEYAVAPSFDSEKASGTVFVKLSGSGALVMCRYPKTGQKMSAGMKVEVQLDSVQPAKKCFYGTIVSSRKKYRSGKRKKHADDEEE